MRLLVTGGTGFVGTPLCQALASQGHEVIAMTRRPRAGPPRVRYSGWEAGDWPGVMAQVDGVIHLAGAPIACRWSPEQKQRIRESRVGLTRRLVEAMAAVSPRPTVLISASAIGYYGPRGDEVLDEAASSGSGFLADVCRAWEAEAQRAEALGVRVVRLRLGLVLGPGGGVLAKMAPPFRAWLGGPLGNGRPWVSWIHREDVLGLIQWALTHAALSGPVNAVAPGAVRMRDFCRELGRALRRPSWAPVPAIVLRTVLGEMSEMLLTGQRLTPAAAMRAGYPFQFPALSAALSDCLRQEPRAVCH